MASSLEIRLRRTRSCPRPREKSATPRWVLGKRSIIDRPLKGIYTKADARSFPASSSEIRRTRTRSCPSPNEKSELPRGVLERRSIPNHLPKGVNWAKAWSFPASSLRICRKRTRSCPRLNERGAITFVGYWGNNARWSIIVRKAQTK